MQIDLSPQDGVPIYRQIVNQVTYQIASGQLRRGEELPAIRALAEQLLVTPNTVVKAYRELESAGLVYKRAGAGTYVSDLRQSPLARKERKRILVDRVDALLADARRLKFSFSEVQELLHDRQEVLEQAQQREEERAG